MESGMDREDREGTHTGRHHLSWKAAVRDGFRLAERPTEASATRLSKQGEVENADMRSWHTHMLRHSFKSEAEHAGVSSGLVEFMMGHNNGIGWVYDNRDQIHQEDFVDAYKKLEPPVSLDYSETTMREEFDEERKSWITEIASLRMEVARFAGSSSRGPLAAGGSKAAQPEES
jgi:hypothetical protein